ncbi:hypothetical protein YC2023_050020 [Brassica napus]
MLIFINDVICLGQNCVLEVRALIKDKLKILFWFFIPITFDIVKILILLSYCWGWIYILPQGPLDNQIRLILPSNPTSLFYK